MNAKDILMHIGTADEITVTAKPAGVARPNSSFGLVSMPASGTPARCPSFGAGEAHDAGLCCFIGQIVDIFAVFPQCHPLVVMPSLILMPHSMRISNEKRPDCIRYAEIDHALGGFMPLVTNTPLGMLAHFVLGLLQSLPSTGILLASGLLFRELPTLLAALPL